MPPSSFFRRAQRRPRASILLALTLAVAFAWTSHARGGGRGAHQGPGRSLLELRLAVVNRDASFASTRTEASHRAKFEDTAALTWGFEVVQLPARLRDVGALGIGLGFHLHHHESLGSSQGRDVKTIFQMVPMHVYLLGQLDGPAHCCSALFVPYAKLGAAAAPWKLRRGQDEEVDGELEYVNTTLGGGVVYGISWALGVRLSLDGPLSSDREALGIRHTYVFGEHMRMPLRHEDGTRLDLCWWTGGVAAQW